jgi:hypothetical protein
MTRDDIIRFGEQADEVADRKIKMRGEYHPDWHEVRDEAFAKLVAAAERDKCYQIAMSEAASGSLYGWPECAYCIAKAIRARGKA